MQRKTPKQPRRLLAGLATRMCEIDLKKLQANQKSLLARLYQRTKIDLCICLVAYTPASACVCGGGI